MTLTFQANGGYSKLWTGPASVLEADYTNSSNTSTTWDDCNRVFMCLDKCNKRFSYSGELAISLYDLMVPAFSRENIFSQYTFG